MRVFRRFLNYASQRSRRSKLDLLIDAFGSTFKYNISLLDYFYFRFFSLPPIERSKWAGTGFMYEYQLRMNPAGAREVLIDKNKFLKQFNSFVKRKFASLQEIERNPSIVKRMLGNASGRLVMKRARGQAGAQIQVIQCADFSPEKLISMMHSKGYDLLEEYVIQHPAMMQLSPAGLNTVRIITQLDDGKIYFLGARLRISVNSAVDNMAADNIAAPIDINSGIVFEKGVYSDITKPDVEFHPVTGYKIVGFKIPFWEEILEMAEKVAIETPINKSVGWDIAITETGPELIEGNHNWCKLLWQLPVKKGLKTELEKYL